jgi:hypothetical protein
MQSRTAIALFVFSVASYLGLAQQPEGVPAQSTPQQVPADQAAKKLTHHYSEVKYKGNTVGWVAVEANPDKIQDCSNNAPGGCAGDVCLVTIDRNLPISPATLSMPGGTTVFIKLLHPHPDESIAFNDVTAKVAPEDLAADALKSLVSPASSLIVTQALFNFNFSTNAKKPRKTEKLPAEDPVPGLATEVLAQLQKVTDEIQDANTTLACLETYKPVVGEKGHKTCDPTGVLGPNDLTTADGTALSAAIDSAKSAAGKDLPIAELKYIDALLTKDMTECIKKKPGNECYATLDNDQSIENLYNTQVTSLQTAQGALLQNVQTLSTLPPQEDQFIFKATLDKNNNATITITGTEFVTKTATTIGTVTVNTTPTRFVLSTGVMYTSTPYRTYAITNEVSNGVATGTTEVTKSSSIPSIDFPVVFGSYLFRSLSQAKWENKCPNHCALLFSAGLGLNLGAKTADLAGGPSFQIGGFIFTPVAVGARQNHLLNGVYVGQTNSGFTMSSNLPTANHWTVGGGFALTYTIPTP